MCAFTKKKKQKNRNNKKRCTLNTYNARTQTTERAQPLLLYETKYTRTEWRVQKLKKKLHKPAQPKQAHIRHNYIATSTATTQQHCCYQYYQRNLHRSQNGGNSPKKINKNCAASLFSLCTSAARTTEKKLVQGEKKTQESNRKGKKYVKLQNKVYKCCPQDPRCDNSLDAGNSVQVTPKVKGKK